jgi:hypothetical protein
MQSKVMMSAAESQATQASGVVEAMEVWTVAAAAAVP